MLAKTNSINKPRGKLNTKNQNNISLELLNLKIKSSNNQRMDFNYFIKTLMQLYCLR